METVSKINDSANVVSSPDTSGRGAAIEDAATARIRRTSTPSAAQTTLSDIVRQLNATSRSIGRALRFQVNVISGSSTIQVLDRDTGEIIREIPPEKIQINGRLERQLTLRLFDELA